MDWINKIHNIVEKIKNQLHEKGIDSLDRIFIAISVNTISNNFRVSTPTIWDMSKKAILKSSWLKLEFF